MLFAVCPCGGNGIAPPPLEGLLGVAAPPGEGGEPGAPPPNGLAGLAGAAPPGFDTSPGPE